MSTVGGRGGPARPTPLTSHISIRQEWSHVAPRGTELRRAAIRKCILRLLLQSQTGVGTEYLLIFTRGDTKTCVPVAWGNIMHLILTLPPADRGRVTFNISESLLLLTESTRAEPAVLYYAVPKSGRPPICCPLGIVMQVAIGLPTGQDHGILRLSSEHGPAIPSETWKWTASFPGPSVTGSPLPLHHKRRTIPCPCPSTIFVMV